MHRNPQFRDCPTLAQRIERGESLSHAFEAFERDEHDREQCELTLRVHLGSRIPFKRREY